MVQRTLHLMGKYKDLIPSKYDGVVTSDLNNINDIISFLDEQFDYAAEKMKDERICISDGPITASTKKNQRQSITENNCQLGFTSKDIYIMPALEGGKNGFMAALGFAAMALAFIPTGGASGILGTTGIGIAEGIAFGGSTLVLSGLGLTYSALTMPEAPDYNTDEDTRDRPSSVVGNLAITDKEGATLPLVFGFDVPTGGVVIHTDIIVENAMGGNEDYNWDQPYYY